MCMQCGELMKREVFGYALTRVVVQGQLVEPAVCLSDRQACENDSLIYKTDVGWLVGCFGLNDPLRQYFSLYRAVSQREGERKIKCPNNPHPHPLQAQ